MRGTSYGADQFVLYGNPMSGPSHRVALMLALSGQPFEYRPVDLMALEQKAPAFRDVNRFGQVPALSHGPLNLCQSDAILLHLARHLEKFDGGGDVLATARITEWLFWSKDRLDPGIFRPRLARKGIRPMTAETEAYYRADAVAALKTLAHAMEGRDWIVGHSPTIADISLCVTLGMAADAGHDLSADWPVLASWLARFQALPGWAPAATLMPPNT